MKCLFPGGRSLSYYAFMAWLLPGITAGIVCIFVFFGAAFLEFRNDQQRIISGLKETSSLVARRISAELLIGPRGAPASVADTLKQDLALESVEIAADRPACLEQGMDVCTLSRGSTLVAFRLIPVVTESRYIAVARRIEPFTAHLKATNLLWSALPIALMFGIGLLLQRMILRRYFLRPIQALVDTSTGDQQPRAYWPKELRDISESLYRTFEARDEAIFSQIARGVIHDLRTLIQAPLVATELAVESRTDPSRRDARLINLEQVCDQQLPKIRDIIDTTLDGSRDITVRQAQAPLESAISGASRTLAPLIAQTGSALTVVNDSTGFLVAHDAVQLERAVTNLLKNAIEAASSGSDCPQVSVRVHHDARQVTIDVEDSGPGLRVQADRLFRPLKSTKPHGSGLGLVICRKIIASHNGRLIPARSESLGGAKFSIVLPLVSEAT